MNSIFLIPGVGSSSPSGFSPSSPYLFTDGTAGAPSISFASEPTLGLWRNGTANITVQATTFTVVGDVSAGSGQKFNITNKWNIYGPAIGNLVMRDSNNTFGSQFKFDALPTIASGFGTGASIVAGSTPLAGAVNVGTGGVATSGVINFNGTAFPSAPFVVVTTNAVSNPTQAVQSSTTQLSLYSTSAWLANTIVYWIAISPK